MATEQRDVASILLEAISAIAAELPKDLAGDERRPEVTGSQLAALRYLAAHGTCEMRALASGVGVTAPTMTSTIKLLVKKGLVDRQHDNDDWRKVLITLTALGVITQGQFADARSQALAEAMSHLGADHRALLQVALPALRALATALSAR